MISLALYIMGIILSLFMIALAIIAVSETLKIIASFILEILIITAGFYFFGTFGTPFAGAVIIISLVARIIYNMEDD